MRTYSILALVLWLLVTSCGKQPTTSNHIIWKIDPTSAIKTDLRLFVDSISLVPLSTNDNSLIKKVRSIDYVNNKFYINNNLTDIQVYDNNGTFLYGTKQHLGGGPDDYISAISFHVLPNDTIEILDAISYKLRYFLHQKGFISSYTIPKEILPVYQYEWLNKDTCIFSDGDTKNPILRMYSKSRGKIIKEIEDKQKSRFVKTSSTLYKTDEKLYFSAPYPSNELYILNRHLGKELVLQLDFGKHNFAMVKLPEDMNAKSSSNYFSTHQEYVYPYSKYVSDDFIICSFQYDNHMYIAYKNKKNGTDVIFRNETGKYPQFMPAQHVQGNKVFYASEPGYISYLIDTTLMNKTDINKMKHISEMDNPVIIIYTMK